MRPAVVLAAAAVLAALAAAASVAAEPEFPPIARLLGPLEPDAPVRPLEGLKDSLADRPSLPWLLGSLRAARAERRLEAVRELGRLDVEAVPYLTAVLLNLQEPEDLRLAAAASLGRVGGPIARDHLAQALKDPEREVRFAAVFALAKTREGGVETLLEERLRRDPSWWVRYAAAVALGRLRRPFSVDALARASNEDPQWQVRLEAARALGELGTERAFAALAIPLRDRNEAVRAVSAIALGAGGGDPEVALLRSAFGAEKDEVVRSLLASSLRRSLALP